MMEPYFLSDDEAETGFRDSPEFDNLKDEVMALLFEINGQISTTQQFIGSLEHILEENGDVHAKVVSNISKRAVSTISAINEAIRKLDGLVSEISAIEKSSLDTVELVGREKVLRDVTHSVQEFQTAQRQFASVARRINDRARQTLNLPHTSNEIALHEEEMSDTHGKDKIPSRLVVQLDPINNEEFAYHQALIRERDQEISNIESGITELNTIFKDLSAIIQTQGIQVDHIESNIYSARSDTRGASKELDKALRYQKRASKWCLYLLITLVILLFLFIFMLAI